MGSVRDRNCRPLRPLRVATPVYCRHDHCKHGRYRDHNERRFIVFASIRHCRSTVRSVSAKTLAGCCSAKTTCARRSAIVHHLQHPLNRKRGTGSLGKCATTREQPIAARAQSSSSSDAMLTRPPRAHLTLTCTLHRLRARLCARSLWYRRKHTTRTMRTTQPARPISSFTSEAETTQSRATTNSNTARTGPRQRATPLPSHP
jgi:hypothetical protein